MNIRNFLRTLVAACAFTIAAQASATAILQVNSAGILTGATGVNVAGTLYNVTFADGSCNSLFNGCKPAAFTFTLESTAVAAAQALLDQVFIDGAAGQFDSDPSKVFGCGLWFECFSYIPYSALDTSQLFVAYSYNNFTIDKDSAAGGIYQTDRDPTADNSVNYAIFEVAPPSAGVPEPSSIALIGLAIAGIVFTRRRKA